MYQKKLLIHIWKDLGQLHVHAKVGRFSYTVTPRTGFLEKMTLLCQQKVMSMPKIFGLKCMECTLDFYARKNFILVGTAPKHEHPYPNAWTPPLRREPALRCFSQLTNCFGTGDAFNETWSSSKPLTDCLFLFQLFHSLLVLEVGGCFDYIWLIWAIASFRS